MRLTLLALGSRGDVQPLVALALRLRDAGHQPLLAAAGDYASLATDYGLPFAPLVGSIADLMNIDLALASLEAAQRPLPLTFARRFVAHVTPLVERLIADCLAACRTADALVLSTLGVYPGYLVAERLGVPVILTTVHPAAASATYPDYSFPDPPAWLPLGGWYNRLTHHVARHGLWQLLRPALNAARQRVLGQPPLSAFEMWRWVERWRPLTLNAYSPLIAPPPPDWGPRQVVTGYWRLERPVDWRPPAALERFLAAGPPPVYVGFGSILGGRDPDGLTRLIVAALALAGQRGLIYRGWGDLGNIAVPASVLAIDSVPHDWLFPRLAAVVTHGGAGTTAAALRAGVPPIVVPSFVDQHFWGKRVAALGAGPPAIARRHLTAERLAAAIGRAVGERRYRQRAALIGARLQREDGRDRAVRAIECLMGESVPPPRERGG